MANGQAGGFSTEERFHIRCVVLTQRRLADHLMHGRLMDHARLTIDFDAAENAAAGSTQIDCVVWRLTVMDGPNSTDRVPTRLTYIPAVSLFRRDLGRSVLPFFRAASS